MEKKIIAGLAALLLSTGLAAAQSAGGTAQTNAGSTASNSTDTQMSAASAKKAAPGHMSRSEARVNQAEIQETKELNLEESQQVAAANAKAHVSVPSGAMSANEGSSANGQANVNPAPDDETANGANMDRGAPNGTEAMNNGAGGSSSAAPQNPGGGSTGSSEMSNGGQAGNSAGSSP